MGLVKNKRLERGCNFGRSMKVRICYVYSVCHAKATQMAEFKRLEQETDIILEIVFWCSTEALEGIFIVTYLMYICL